LAPQTFTSPFGVPPFPLLGFFLLGLFLLVFRHPFLTPPPSSNWVTTSFFLSSVFLCLFFSLPVGFLCTPISVPPTVVLSPELFPLKWHSHLPQFQGPLFTRSCPSKEKSIRPVSLPTLLLSFPFRLFFLTCFDEELFPVAPSPLYPQPFFSYRPPPLQSFLKENNSLCSTLPSDSPPPQCCFLLLQVCPPVPSPPLFVLHLPSSRSFCGHRGSDCF